MKMFRPEIEIIEVLDIVTASGATQPSSKPGIDTEPDEF